MKCYINKLVPAFLVFIASVLISCGDHIDSVLNEKLAGANRVNIYFYDKEQGMKKDPRMVVVISDQGEIKKILVSITDITSEQYKCGYSGQLEVLWTANCFWSRNLILRKSASIMFSRIKMTCNLG